jgi:hypothetical protein
MSQLGRISGPLLKDNLIRDGVDLRISNTELSTSLLYFNVNDRQISINTAGEHELTVDSTTKTFNLISSGIKVANIEFALAGDNIISTTSGGITLTPNQTDPLIVADQLRAGDINLKDNAVSNYQVNGSIELRANSNRLVNFDSSTTINGDLLVTGNINIDGSLTKNGDLIIGDNGDTVTVTPNFRQSIIPGIDLTYDLGTASKRWRKIYVNDNSDITSLSYTSITVGNQLQMDGLTRQIYTLQSNDSVLLNPDTGIVDTESIRFQENDITNLNSDTVFSINSTGIGYVRFIGTNGVVIPAGTTPQRPLAPEVGDTRWNTDIGRLECWDGSVYIVATGPGATIGEVEMTDLQFVYAVMLG